ncbi:MAG: family 43 glycosylhydrolase [Clostridia bacterium]|nr:family 43 glycosylhydrolase [Clostridia bacterium]
MKRKEIRIRDPFILTDKENGCYYMYGTTDLKPFSMEAGNTFAVYKSYDLENFEAPIVVFDGEEQGFYADRDFWAAEVHQYQGKYYLFGTVKSEKTFRATHIFVSDTPYGKFTPLTTTARTPESWECIDGTLWV